MYISAQKKVYQFDLDADDVEASKIEIAEWDGVSNPFPTIFYLSALAPNGKIYISSTSSTLNLHVIEEPNQPGLACNLVQRGVELPSFNFATIPNLPHYCGQDEVDCIVSSVGNELQLDQSNSLLVYPNPTQGVFTLSSTHRTSFDSEFQVQVLNSVGQLVYSATKERLPLTLDLSLFKSGVYTILVSNHEAIVSKKIVKH